MNRCRLTGTHHAAHRQSCAGRPHFPAMAQLQPRRWPDRYIAACFRPVQLHLRLTSSGWSGAVADRGQRPISRLRPPYAPRHRWSAARGRVPSAKSLRLPGCRCSSQSPAHSAARQGHYQKQGPLVCGSSKEASSPTGRGQGKRVFLVETRLQSQTSRQCATPTFQCPTGQCR